MTKTTQSAFFYVAKHLTCLSLSLSGLTKQLTLFFLPPRLVALKAFGFIQWLQQIQLTGVVLHAVLCIEQRATPHQHMATTFGVLHDTLFPKNQALHSAQ